MKASAREFWESVLLESIGGSGNMPAATAAENADLALAEWRKRWTDEGKPRKSPPPKPFVLPQSQTPRNRANSKKR